MTLILLNKIFVFWCIQSKGKNGTCAHVHKTNSKFLIKTLLRMSKQADEMKTALECPAKGSPEKAMTPAKKAKEKQMLTHGQSSEVECLRIGNFKLWHIMNSDDNKDAFVKNLIDDLHST